MTFWCIDTFLVGAETELGGCERETKELCLWATERERERGEDSRTDQTRAGKSLGT